MKNIGIGIGIICFFVISLFTIFSIDTRKIRSDELEASASNSLPKNLERDIYDEGQIKSNIEQSIISQISKKSKLQIDYLTVDKKIGLISIGVKETFRYPNGNIGTIYTKKTLIKDEHINNEPQKVFCVVELYDDSNLLTTIRCEAGTKIKIPAYIENEKIINKWVDEQNNLINDDFVVQTNVKLFANNK